MKIRYYVTRKAWPGSRATWGYWVPTKKMKALGFATIACGEDGPSAWAIAERWNTRWDTVRSGRDVGAEPNLPDRERRIWPPNSLGEAFAKLRGTTAWRDAKKPRTKEDWWRGWDLIAPVFGDVDPATLALEELDAWYAGLLERVGVREAHRAMKIWRALWRVAGTLNRNNGARYCVRDADPSLGIRRKTPTARDAFWLEGEAVRLVKTAIRNRYHGLAALLAVAWDTMLSPVDVRALTKAQLRGDAEGSLFALARAKTGRAAVGTLGKRAQRILDAYMATLPANLLPSAPIFLTRNVEPVARRGHKGEWGGDHGGGRPRPSVPYTANKLQKDFRKMRTIAFPGDTRVIGDFRRSGALEAIAGEVHDGALSAKMANTIEQSRELQATYLPHQAAVVRLADEARARGRARLRASKEPGK